MSAGAAGGARLAAFGVLVSVTLPPSPLVSVVVNDSMVDNRPVTLSTSIASEGEMKVPSVAIVSRILENTHVHSAVGPVSPPTYSSGEDDGVSEGR